MVVRALGLLVASGIPLGVYIALIGDSPYWLDSAEFVGAAFALQPSHPPGHPLYILVGRALMLLPAGSAAFRMNLLSALCAAGALALTFDAAVRILRDGFRVYSPLAVITPALACLLAGVSDGWLHQALHAEVYALQALLLAAIIWCCVRGFLVSADEQGQRSRWLLTAAVFVGLSLANHHLTGFLLVPPIIAAITISALQVKLTGPMRLVVISIFAMAVPLLIYALIPVRGWVDPSLILGRVETFSDFMWLVSAKVYQKSIGSGWAQGQDMEGVVFLIAEQVGIALVILSLAGFYLMVRVKETRAVGVLLVIAAAGSVGGRLMLQFDRTNPDIMGYLLVVLLTVAVAITALGAALSNLARGRRWLQVIALIAVALLPGWEIWSRAPSLIERFGRLDRVERAQYEVRQFGVARIPPGSVAVTTLYSTCFLTWYGRVVEGERPDVRHVPLPFVGYRGEAAVLVDTWEELAPLVRGFLVSGALPASEVATLSQERAVFLEPDPFLDDAHIQYLEPHGLFMAFNPEPVARRDVMAAADESSERIDALLRLSGHVLDEPQTKRFVLWWLYNRTLVLARRGYTVGAIRSADQALGLVPGIPELEALKAHLEKNPKPLENPAPFIP